MKTFFLSHYGGRAWFAGAALAGVIVGFSLAQCCGPPPGAQQPATKNLARQVSQALAGHEDSAGQYAAFYELLADRFESQQYETTARAAQIAGRAADILELPGHLEQIVGEQLDPHLGEAGPLSPEQSQAAADSLRDLAAACQEAGR